MKKSVIIAGAILLMFSSALVASNLTAKNQIELSTQSLHLAISKGDIESVKKFIHYGADVNKMSKDMTPLMVAARYNEFEIIKLLLANGAKASDKNERGYTALDYAEYSKATESIAILKDLK